MILKPKCHAPRCSRLAETRGLCSKHYQQTRRHGRLKPETEYRARGSVCYIRNCPHPVKAKGLCMKHYQRKARKS
jgi:hypothetical protein